MSTENNHSYKKINNMDNLEESESKVLDPETYENKNSFEKSKSNFNGELENTQQISPS
jgi:hypothetical protein